jgi:hypothetical protein
MVLLGQSLPAPWIDPEESSLTQRAIRTMKGNAKMEQDKKERPMHTPTPTNMSLTTATGLQQAVQANANANANLFIVDSLVGHGKDPT